MPCFRDQENSPTVISESQHLHRAPFSLYFCPQPTSFPRVTYFLSGQPVVGHRVTQQVCVRSRASVQSESLSLGENSKDQK